jgi:6-phosphogluconolactonase (cycloisomerase 2 family)
MYSHLHHPRLPQHNERPDRTRSRAAWKCVAVVLLFLFGPVPCQVIAQRETRNTVYVESNDPNGNAIFAFSRASDGSLTPLPGSPFPTGGLGLTPTFNLGPFDSDQEVILNPSGSMLFAVNGGSDSISVFQVNNDGSLSAVAGSPFSSGGSSPVSVGLAHDTLCVVNQDEDPGHPGQFLPNYTSFHVGPTGKLTPVPNSTITVDAGSSPSQALTSASGRLLFGADFLGGLLRSFNIASNGRLTVSAAQPLPPSLFEGTGASPFPLGLALNPKHNLLYVGLVTINQVAVYSYDNSGALNFLCAVPDSGHGVCWLLTNRQGTTLYASNTGDPSISVFDIRHDAANPIEIQKVNMVSSGGCFQFALDSSDRFLHVVTQQSSPTSTVTANALHVFKVLLGGALQEVPSSPTILPVPNLVRPQGVAAR